MPPARCGLASFSADLIEAVRRAAPRAELVGIAMRQQCDATAIRPAYAAIEAEQPASYDGMAALLNRDRLDLLCLQHEYGIFGGPDGEHLLRLLDRVRMPVVTTLHTVLEAPSRNQRRVMSAIIDRADRLVVMTERSASVMRQVHHVADDKLCVIGHGIPDRVPSDRAAGTAMLGSAGRTVLMTFGLLSPGKGIEHVVAALPAIAAAIPDVLYVVVGATHPNLLRQQGEGYRHELQRLAERLGVSRHVRFVDRYVDLPELTAALAATDIYITPYLNEAQSVSGTLAYSYGLGNAVVSTPYHHAAELLADGRGELVPFADPGAVATAVIGLLSDPARIGAMRRAALRAGAEMGWSRVGERYVSLFRELGALLPHADFVPSAASWSAAAETAPKPVAAQ